MRTKTSLTGLKAWKECEKSQSAEVYPYFWQVFPLKSTRTIHLFHTHLLLHIGTLMTESDNTDRYIMSHSEPRTTLQHIGKGLCSRGEKESPPQWDSSGEAKSSSGNINSSASVRGTCWFNAFLSPGEQSSIINDLVLMQNDNTVWCTTINARICRLETDFDYHWHVLFLQKKTNLLAQLLFSRRRKKWSPSFIPSAFLNWSASLPRLLALFSYLLQGRNGHFKPTDLCVIQLIPLRPVIRQKRHWCNSSALQSQRPFMSVTMLWWTPTLRPKPDNRALECCDSKHSHTGRGGVTQVCECSKEQVDNL